MEQRVIISTQLESELVSALSECEHDKLLCLQILRHWNYACLYCRIFTA